MLKLFGILSMIYKKAVTAFAEESEKLEYRGIFKKILKSQMIFDTQFIFI